MNYTKFTKKYARHFEHLEIVQANRKSISLDGSIKILEDFVSGENKTTNMGLVGGRFYSLADWFQGAGLYELLQENVAIGQEYFQQAISYFYWRVQIEAHFIRQQPRSLETDTPLFMLQMLAIGQEQPLKTLLDIFETNQPKHLDFMFSDSRYLPFFIRICELFYGRPMLQGRAISTMLSCYQDLIDLCDEPDSSRLHPAIAAACDQHLKEAKASTNNKTYDFEGPVFSIYPVEILALLRYRRRKGLDEGYSFDSAHPLMQLPSSRLFEFPQPLINPPLAEAVLAKIRESTPNLPSLMA